MTKYVHGSVEAAEASALMESAVRRVVGTNITRLTEAQDALRKDKAHVTDAYITTALEQLHGLMDELYDIPKISTNPRHF